MPKISVILPVWNGEQYLAEAIDSVLAQDYANKELIVVDDGSTDNTSAIIEKYAPHIRSITQINSGLGASRNSAIRIATGDYFAFLDHDDYWTKDKLSLQMQALTKDDPLIFSHVKQFICPTLSKEERNKLLVNESPLPGYIAGTLLISRERFFQIGPFLEERKLLGEFIEWYLRAHELNIPMHMLPQVLLHRRVHKDNMGRRDLSRRTDYLRILKASLDRRRIPA